MVSISHALSKITGSATSQAFAKAIYLENKGREILHFEIGQPDFLPLDSILKATSNAVLNGKVRYTMSKGIPELRRAIATYYKQFLLDKVDFESEVVVTAGGKLGIYAAIQSVTNPGDNVVILNPSWVSYKDIVLATGATPRYVAIDRNFIFDEVKLRSQIDSKTRAIIVNSPNNPTGAILNKKGMQTLYDLATEYDLLVISDEVYNEFVYGKHKFVSLGNIKNWKERGIIINGLSKTFSMTGYRLGYTLTNAPLSKEINKIMQLTASCAPSFAQYAGVVAFDSIKQMRERIHTIMPSRRELITKELATITNISFSPPQGTIYAWVKLTSITDSVKWADSLLNTKGVAVMPGRAFGPDGEGYIRISFATSESVIKEGLSRIRSFANK